MLVVLKIYCFVEVAIVYFLIKVAKFTALRLQ